MPINSKAPTVHSKTNPSTASWYRTAIVNTLSYDGADQLVNAVQSGGGSATNAYNYDPAGNRLAETTASTTTAGRFNKLNQLIATSSSATTQTVSGHTTANVAVPAGTNIVSIVATPSTGPVTTKRYQIVTTGTTPTALTYDANGNCTQDENGNTYKWDALNRLTAIIYNSGTYSGTHTEFAYDGLSRRVSIVERAGTTVGSGTVSSTKLYIWVGSEIAEERASNGTTINKQFFPQGEEQSVSGTLTPYYYFRDHLGSVRELVGSTGTTLTRYGYDPYGKPAAPIYLSGSTDATFRYAGYYYHPASTLNLTQYRAYDSNTGRWLSRDSIGEVLGGGNLFAYCANNPGNFNDPLGLDPVPPPPNPTNPFHSFDPNKLADLAKDQAVRDQLDKLQNQFDKAAQDAARKINDPNWNGNKSAQRNLLDEMKRRSQNIDKARDIFRNRMYWNQVLRNILTLPCRGPIMLIPNPQLFMPNPDGSVPIA
jgi:RHS repeat-associated protein